MISLLVGDDRYAISKKLLTFKKSLDPAWLSFNYHRFHASAVDEAIYCALTPALGSVKAKLVIVEDCNFKQFDEAVMDILQLLPKVPQSTHLIFVASNLDKRLKVSKFLLSQSQLFEFNLIAPWRIDLIAQYIRTQSLRIGLSLDKKSGEYLADAIGNDSARIESELQLLALYSNNAKLSLKQVRSLIPSTTQNSLQLAKAIRENNAQKAVDLLQKLLTKETFPAAICATLITQFRTWLWVKSTIVKGVKSDAEIAKICQISNFKRVYFLKQEVQTIPLQSLVKAVSLLLDLEIALKQGKRNSLLSSILAITQLFASQPVKTAAKSFK
ncbi:DNA polymerase III subunit delta [Planktothrix sp. FACHB-1365]|uniref:DNA polymerase III subunit delta n=1 Tax=Planktothrix sp. FACHB-1365 TaxID=2692855 RepID=UPI00168262B1|nr:DNA polymerase III subunit delta [Planktothrix sp. FACHB-1365]MBD2485565.1 DNA polymerase III subunit delta [Planktothrix sp. FACHB-1365]